MAAQIVVAAEAQELSKALRRLVPKRVDPSPIIKTQLPFYGVKVGELRRLARSWAREHPEVSPTQVIELCDGLWSITVREEMVLACLILERKPAALDGLTPTNFDSWRKSLDNWETTDQLGQVVLAQWVTSRPQQRLKELERLAAASDPWSRRLGLVGTIGLARGDRARRYWPRTGKLILKLSRDREAAMPKAISWVLRENLRHCAAEVSEFVDLHAEELPAVAVRETRKKLVSGKKA